MEIFTEHLVLREFEESDFDAILAYQTDPRYLRFYERTWAERTPEQVHEFLDMMLSYRREEPRSKFQLAMTLREGGRLIGNVGVRKDKAGSTQAEIGCELAPDEWNLGYATEATRAMMQFGFDKLGLHRLWASAIAGNWGAWRVLEKLGMKREGELRETTLLADGWANSFVYGILEQEWRELTRDRQ